jgi:hypothetical protein
MEMTDDYLWDKTGRDAEVEALERLLAPAALGAKRPAPKARPLPWIAGLAAAALFAAGALHALRSPAAPDPWVAQADGSRQLDLGPYGSVVAEPDARVRVVKRDDTVQKLRLDRGTIHASITLAARPRLFQVETPATTCIDLGCRYTLNVDAAGVSRVQVESGRVAFHDGRREVFIPEGASGSAAPGRPASTPIFNTATPELKRAVEAFDAAPVGKRAGPAQAACTFIQKRDDGLVAWHWLQDPEADVVKAAREALVRLTTLIECGVPRPKDVKSLREWRDSLFPEWTAWGEK